MIREFVILLCLHPDSGDVIPGTGGLRKLRWRLKHKGKRGGIRILYIDFAYYEKIYFVSAYAKNVRVNLTQAEKNEIKKLIKILEQELEGSGPK